MRGNCLLLIRMLWGPQVRRIYNRFDSERKQNNGRICFPYFAPTLAFHFSLVTRGKVQSLVLT